MGSVMGLRARSSTVVGLRMGPRARSSIGVRATGSQDASKVLDRGASKQAGGRADAGRRQGGRKAGRSRERSRGRSRRGSLWWFKYESLLREKRREREKKSERRK